MEPEKLPVASRGFRVSVVICAYTEARWSEMVDAIESIRYQTVPPIETILVIDHNPELFARSKAAFPDVICVENSEERGLSGARNSGIAVTSGNVIAFMDEDATADKSWLEELSRHFTDPRTLGVGGAILPQWRTGQPAWFPAEFHWVVGCTYLGLPEEAAPVRNLIGCNMSFRKEIFLQIGMFRNGIGRVGTIPAGCEETEICIRARQHNRRGIFLYEPRAQVRHCVPAQRTTLRYFVSRCFAEGRSKALVTGLVGAKDGLSTERGYVTRTLLAGVGRGLRELIMKRKISGAQRAAAILVGLTTTVLGYVTGKAVLMQNKAV